MVNRQLSATLGSKHSAWRSPTQRYFRCLGLGWNQVEGCFRMSCTSSLRITYKIHGVHMDTKIPEQIRAPVTWRATPKPSTEVWPRSMDQYGSIQPRQWWQNRYTGRGVLWVFIWFYSQLTQQIYKNTIKYFFFACGCGIFFRREFLKQTQMT